MSQSASLCRISEDTFGLLKKSDSINRKEVYRNSIKSQALFQGTFMGLEFILSRGQDDPTVKIAKEIFYPGESLGVEGYENLTEEEQYNALERGEIIFYHDPQAISRFNNLLDSFSTIDLHKRYSSKEFKDNDIYPWVWHDDNSPNQAFNERHLTEDLAALKTIVKDALLSKDYILVFLG